VAIKDQSKTLTPKLRFPEFVQDGPWSMRSLDELCDRIFQTVGDVRLTPVSITAGRGFVSQAEKFGRDISGAQYKNYIRLRRGEFAYNKGNSNLYPQGCVYQLKEFEEAAASNAFICFRLKNGNAPGFFEGLFEKNAHGLQLSKFLTSGARSDGLLNIKADEFFSVRLPIPPDPAEQRKIAACLTSLDDLLAAEGRKLEALRTHKKGLMQQLFPREGESRPRLRFPEFRDKPEWQDQALADLCTATISYGIVQAGPHVPDGMPYIKSTDLNSPLCLVSLARTSQVIAKKYRRSEVVPGDLVFSLRGNIGVTQIVPEEIRVANLTQGTARVRTRGPAAFFIQALRSQPVHDRIMAVSKGSTLQEISLDSLRKVRLRCPDVAEQQRIAACLSSLDALIAAQSRKLNALRTHKKGLMQQLFPPPEET
jgi:type I restriction enzyme, S subunit